MSRNGNPSSFIASVSGDISITIEVWATVATETAQIESGFPKISRSGVGVSFSLSASTGAKRIQAISA